MSNNYCNENKSYQAKKLIKDKYYKLNGEIDFENTCLGTNAGSFLGGDP